MTQISFSPQISCGGSALKRNRNEYCRRALCVRRARRFRLVDQFLKKRAVMNHGLAQVFGGGLALRLTNCTFWCAAR